MQMIFSSNISISAVCRFPMRNANELIYQLMQNIPGRIINRTNANDFNAGLEASTLDIEERKQPTTCSPRGATKAVFRASNWLQ